MNKILFSTFLAFAVSTTYFVGAGVQDDYMKARMLGDLDFIKNTFCTTYALSDWKMVYSGWDLEEQIAISKARVEAADEMSTHQFQRVVKDFFLSSKDYHVSVEFYSTASAKLPFLIEGANHRYFFSYIDYGEASGDREFPFAVGDELLYFDGMPIDEVITNLMLKEFGDNHPSTDRMLAQINLTTRVGKDGDDIPSGDVIITGKRQEDGEVLRVELKWDHANEKITDLFGEAFKKTWRYVSPHTKIMKLLKGNQTDWKRKIGSNPYFHKQFIYPKYAHLAEVREEDDEGMKVLGARKSSLPTLGELLWECPEETYFYAYLFKTPGGKSCGYVRIPRYTLEDPEYAAEEFAETVNYFQEQADVLVIDQLNNPGGSVGMCYALASMLTEAPLEVPKHRRMITQEDLFFAHDTLDFFESIESDEEAVDVFGSTFDGMPTSLNLIRCMVAEFKEIISEWSLGHTFTDYGYIYGVGPIQPHPKGRFTKPIVCLVNGLDFSGGDFFPAILQDNKRAIIMGSRTAGAGGYVCGAGFPNLNGISGFKMTGSVAMRPGNLIIENKGVTPDILYEPSVLDLQSNYVEYKQKIMRVLDTL